LITSSDGNPDVPYGSTYDGFFTASQAFEIGSLGLQRVGAFAYLGQAPTFYRNNLTTSTVIGTDSLGGPVTSTSTAGIPGTGAGNKGFQRYGLIGMFYVKKYNMTAIYFRGSDSAWLGSNTPALAGAVLPAGAQSPKWNGALFESNYDWSPQLILINRYELVRMSQQAFTSNPANLGNLDTLTFGFRYYPFISSRAGFAYHAEYGIIWQKGASPVTFSNLTTSSLLFGFDFDF
jgi:hypothetical protein